MCVCVYLHVCVYLSLGWCLHVTKMTWCLAVAHLISGIRFLIFFFFFLAYLTDLSLDFPQVLPTPTTVSLPASRCSGHATRWWPDRAPAPHTTSIITPPSPGEPNGSNQPGKHLRLILSRSPLVQVFFFFFTQVNIPQCKASSRLFMSHSCSMRGWGRLGIYGAHFYRVDNPENKPFTPMCSSH